MKKNIAIDADDVLINSIELLNEFHNNIHGTNFTLDDYTNFNLSDIWGIPKYEVLTQERLFYKSEIHNRMQAVEGAVEAVKYLCENNYDLTVITGRGIDVEKHLHDTLRKLFEPHHFSSVHHVGAPYGVHLSTHKWEKCVELDIKILLDDYHIHLIRAAEYGIHGILFTAPWNKNITDLPKIVKRVRNWTEALEIIDINEKIIFA